jgi:hypothetical protein
LSDTAAELEGALDRNLSYLAAWTGVHTDEDPFAPYPPALPNPVKWAISAQAVTDLELDWPDRARDLGTAWHDKIAATGDELRAALGRITVVKREGKEVANYALFDDLVTIYLGALDDVDDEIEEIERRFATQLSVELGDVSNSRIDVWRSADVRPTYSSPNLAQVSLTGDRPPLGASPAPGKFVTSPFLLADYLKLHPLRLKARAGWTEVQKVLHTPDQDDDGGKGGGKQEWWEATGVLLVTLEFLSGDDVVHVRSIAGPRKSLAKWRSPSPQPPLPDAAAMIASQWEQGPKLRDKFDDTSTEVPPTPEQAKLRTEVLTKVGTDVEKALSQLRLALRAEIVRELSSAGAASAARGLSGAKSALYATTALGMPRSLAADELLRALFFGEQAIVDGTSLIGSLATAELKPLDEKAPTAWLDLRDKQKARAEALKARLHVVLDTIDSGQLRESDPYLETTALWLRVAKLTIVSDEKEDGIVASLPALKRNHKGDHVRRLQALINVAMPTLKLKVDGTFGKTTETAVKEFQKTKGIKADGRVERGTWSLLLGVP